MRDRERDGRHEAPVLSVADAQARPFADDTFGLVTSINTEQQNRYLDTCKIRLREIERVARVHAFVVMYAWRNERARENMLERNLSALAHVHVDDWVKLFAEIARTGDCGWFVAE